MISAFAAVFRSFRYALKGIVRTIKEERNFRVHLVALCLVTWFAFLYEVTSGQALVLILTCALVLSLELTNTAIEHTVDLISEEYHPLAEKAKDAAAGGVLVSAVASVVVAVVMFRDPSHWRLVWEKLASPFRLIPLILFLILSLCFIVGISKNPRKK